MFRLPHFASTAAFLLAVALAAASFANDVRLHVDENLSGGQPVGDLRALLSLAENASLRLVNGSDPRFQLDADGWLITAENARFDFETERNNLRLTLEVVTPREVDPLRDRFASLARNAGIDGAEVDELKHVSRLVPLVVQIADRPEPPQLLSKLFTLESTETPEPGGLWGRVVASDPDSDEQLRFDLPNAPKFLHIDSSTGELFRNEGESLPAVASVTVLVQVTDSARLTARRTYVIPTRQWHRMTPDFAPAVLASQSPVDVRPELAVEAPAHDDLTVPPEEVKLSADVPATIAVEADVSIKGSSQDVSTPLTASGAAVPAQVAQIASSVASEVDARSPARPRGWIEVFGWFVWSFVAVGVIIIISSGMRTVTEHRVRHSFTERVADGTDPADANASRSTHRMAPPTPSSTAISTPLEIEAVLSRLSESFGSGSSPSVNKAESDRACSGSGILRVDDLMTRVLSSAGLVVRGEESGTLTADTKVESPAALSRGYETAVAQERPHPTSDELVHQEGAATLANRRQPGERRTDERRADERDCLEEFRSISRRSSRAEISRHQRERMRDQWMSVGITALACLTTGSVCVIARCFGDTSLPIGFALIAVSIALLMRRSLYPPAPRRRRATDFIEEPPSK